MTTIALRGTATTGSTTVTAPTGVTAGDLLLLVAISASGTTITVPAGWTTLRNVTKANSSTLRMVVAYRLQASGDPTSWTLTGATYHACSAYSGCDSGTPILAENYSSGGAQSTLATPTVDNTNAGAWRVAGWGAVDSVFSSMGAWSTFSPADTRRATANSTQYAVALTDSAASIATGNTSITGNTPAATSNYEAELAWIGIIQPQLSTAITGTDTGTGTESAAVAATAADTAAGTEAAAVTASTPAADTATGTEAAAVAPAAADIAAAAESAALSLQGTDTAVGIEAAGISQGDTDTAAATETAVVSVPVSAADTGTGTEAAAVAASAADTAAGTEAAAVTASTLAADTGVATDVGVAAIHQPDTDAAAATDAAVVVVGVPVSDAATATETAAVAVQASDSAASLDIAESRHAGEAVPVRLRLIKVLPQLPVWTGPSY